VSGRVNEEYGKPAHRRKSLTTAQRELKKEEEREKARAGAVWRAVGQAVDFERDFSRRNGRRGGTSTMPSTTPTNKKPRRLPGRGRFARLVGLLGWLVVPYPKFLAVVPPSFEVPQPLCRLAPA
jgi:hypothetical protein